METSIKEAKQKSFNFRDDYRAASAMESAVAQFEISEEAYKNMPTYDDMPLSMDDLSTTREARAAQMEAQFRELDNLREFRAPTPEDLDRFDAFSERFDAFKQMDAMANDLEGNLKCD